MSQYKEIDVPLPPIEEQQRIVAKLDAMFAEIDKAVSIYKEKISNLTKLKSNTLKQEF